MLDDFREDTMPDRLKNIRCFMLDMDGTFYLGDRIIPGGLEFLDALEKNGLQILSTEQQEDWCRVTAALAEA